MKTMPELGGAWLRGCIERFVADSPANDMGLAGPEPIFDRPLVGVSGADDPLYAFFVEHIGDFYLTPLAIFRGAFPDSGGVSAGELAVVSWILPATQATRRDNAAATHFPCRRWALTRHRGERFNEALRRHVVRELAVRGIAAVAPTLSPSWERRAHGPWAPCSNWSERHAAYAAGLGTFGLCDGLITPLGKAVRIGSVVARLSLPPSPRPYADRHTHCLFHSHGSCGRCIARCPVGALGRHGHDKQLCQHYTHRSANAVIRKRYGIDTDACGLCQTGVPCTDRIPLPQWG
jgi:ferredoxin